MAEAPLPILHDEQDPLPEASWLWRRVFVFAVTAAVLYMVWGAINRLGAAALLQPERGVPALLSLCKSLLFLVLVMVLFYLVAPSAEQITKMIQTAKMLRSGVQIATRKQIQEPNRFEDQAATVGQPPQPAIPAPGAAIGPSGSADTGLDPGRAHAAPTPAPEVTSDDEDYAPRSKA